MSDHATLGNGLLPAGDPFQHGHALLHELISFDIHEVGAGQAVLRDENRLLVPLDIREELGRLTLQGGDEFGTHEVTLKYHFGERKRRLVKPVIADLRTDYRDSATHRVVAVAQCVMQLS